MTILDAIHALAMIGVTKDQIGLIGVGIKDRGELDKVYERMDRDYNKILKFIKASTPINTHKRLETYLDDIGATTSEVVREYLKSTDKVEFLTQCKVYNYRKQNLIKEEPKK